MKKRGLAILLILAITIASVGCGAKESASKSGQENIVVNEADNEPAETSKEDAAPKESDEETLTDETTVTEETEEAKEVPVLKEAVTKNMGCRIGAAVTEAELNDPKVWEIVTTHFNAVTFGNELKPDALADYSVDKCPGTEEAELNGEIIVVPKLNYSRAERMLDKIYEWNAEHPEDKILVKGHVLVWHSQTPEWFFHEDYDKKKDYVNKAVMDKRLEWYIRTVLEHFVGENSKYRDCFYAWDVVNEACSDNGTKYRTDTENSGEPLSLSRHGSNSSWWHIYESNEYIINAFVYANKYAPEWLELYYNDYNETETLKMNQILELLAQLKEKEGAPGEGTRITGMGMQGHYSMTYPGFDRVEYAIKKYAEVVGKVNISELDLKARDGYDGSDEMKPEEYEKQYARYKILYTVMKNQNAADDIEVTGITFWGTVDHYSWLQSTSNVGGGSSKKLPQCPLLFDENYEAKPCFYAFVEE